MAAAIVVVLLGSGVWRALAARQAQQKALAEASSPQQRAQAPLQLAADEIEWNADVDSAGRLVPRVSPE